MLISSPAGLPAHTNLDNIDTLNLEFPVEIRDIGPHRPHQVRYEGVGPHSTDNLAGGPVDDDHLRRVRLHIGKVGEEKGDCKLKKR